MIRPLLPLLAAWLLLPGLAGAAAALDPAPATIALTDGTAITNAFVTNETVEQVEFILGDPKGAHPVISTKPRAKYVRVDYAAGEDPNFQRGEFLRAQNETDKAIEQYRKAATSSRYQWELVATFLALSDLLARQKRTDEALAALKELTDRFPTTIKLPDAVWRRADLKLAKGDAEGANADYALLVRNAAAWNSPEGGTRGIIGQAQVLRAAKKVAEAGAFLADQLARAKVEDDPATFAQVALALAGDQAATGRDDDALATLRRVAYAPVAVEAQCRAHLEWARQLLAAGKLQPAFDHAVLANQLGTSDAEVEGAAGRLVRDIAGRIEKDPALSEQERLEYRTYLRSL